MLNPDKKYARSDGADIPIMYVYLAGRIAGNCIDKCLAWRKQIVNHYANYKNRGVYPISFLDALNSKEADSVDKLGLTSNIPPGLIYDKDILSVQKADVVVANMEDYFEDGIEESMNLTHYINLDGREFYSSSSEEDAKEITPNFEEAFFKLQDKIKNRRENFGTIYETAIAMHSGKPVILITGKERKYIYENHPFAKRASVIVESVDELLENKWLNILYKSIAGAIYE